MSALDRYNALPAEFQSDELGKAVQAHDEAVATHQDAQTRLAAARQALEAAQADVVLGIDATIDAVVTAAARVTALEMVATRYPAPSGPVFVPDATDIARDALTAAVSAIPDVGTLSLEVELAAYKSWPQHWHALGASPIALPDDTALLASAAAFKSERSDNVRAVESWNQPAILGDTLGALERAASLLRSMGDVTARGVLIAEQVRAANEQRREMGFEWDYKPKSIPNADTYASPELRALVKFRREAVPV
jgi:hypothetical protein